MRIYELAVKRFQSWEEWGVGFSTDTDHPFFVWQDNGPEHYGSRCSVSELLSDRWRDHLKRTGGLWLLPLLERFAGGEAITAEAMLGAYEQEHGRPAPVRDL